MRLVKKISTSLTLVIVISAAILTAGIILWQQSKLIKELQRPLLRVPVEVLNWETYRNGELEVAFKYPKDWELSESYGGDRISIRSPKDSWVLIYPSGYQFGSISAADTQKSEIEMKERRATVLSYLTADKKEKWAQDIRIIDHPESWKENNLIHTRAAFLDLRKECVDKEQPIGLCEQGIRYFGTVEAGEKRKIDGILYTLTFIEGRKEEKAITQLPWQPLCGTLLKKPFMAIAGPGEGLTHMAREIVQGYINAVTLAIMGTGKKPYSFSAAEKVFVEDYLKDYLQEYLQTEGVVVGTKVEVPCSVVEAGFVVTTKLTPEQLKNLEIYGRGSIELDISREIQEIIEGAFPPGFPKPWIFELP